MYIKIKYKTPKKMYCILGVRYGVVLTTVKEIVILK